MNLSYYFEKADDPTRYNLKQAFINNDWLQSSDNPLFSNDNFFSDFALSQFEHKDKLERWLREHQLKLCPKSFIVDELNIAFTLEHIIKNTLGNYWILKPAHLNNGEGIFIAQSLDDIKGFFSQSNRYGGQYLLQAYIHDPYLIDDRKFSIRRFIVLSSSGQIYLYNEGYLNLCQRKYDLLDFSLSMHLTNEHLHKDGTLNNQQVLTRYWDEAKYFEKSIEAYCYDLFNPWIKANKENRRKYGILGIDFMIDADKRLWLLEVNHGPCFPKNDEHPLYDKLYRPFWDHIVNEIMLRELSPPVQNKDNDKYIRYFKIVNKV